LRLPILQLFVFRTILTLEVLEWKLFDDFLSLLLRLNVLLLWFFLTHFIFIIDDGDSNNPDGHDRLLPI
jgi:hypothetical protein